MKPFPQQKSCVLEVLCRQGDGKFPAQCAVEGLAEGHARDLRRALHVQRGKGFFDDGKVKTPILQVQGQVTRREWERVTGVDLQVDTLRAPIGHAHDVAMPSDVLMRQRHQTAFRPDRG